MKRVLVVEDEYGTAQALALLLEVEGFDVTLASNGRVALERIARQRPDLVLTDFMMPVMDGARLGEAIRADPALAGLPLVMTTAAEEARVRERFADYDAYLRKPFAAAQLLLLIERLLSRGGPAAGTTPRAPEPGG